MGVNVEGGQRHISDAKRRVLSSLFSTWDSASVLELRCLLCFLRERQ